MQIIISAVLWDKFLLSDMQQLKLADIAASYGLVGVEYRPYWRNPDAELPLVQAAMQKNALISTYACNECILGTAADNIRQSLADMGESLLIAQRLAAPVMRINVSAGEFSKEFIKAAWWQSAVKRLLAMAQKAGVVLALENSSDPAAGNPVLIREIIDLFSSPWLKATYDTGNWLPPGFNNAEAISILSRRVGYVHLKDMRRLNGNFIGCQPGTGQIDFSGLLKTLTELKYNGLYALEFPGGDNPENFIASSLSYLKG